VAVARILCSVSIRVELYDAFDGSSPKAKLAREALNLVISTANAAAPQVDPAKLNADPCAYETDAAVTRQRPFYVLPNVVPMAWEVSYNSFRRADEFSCTLPLALLPLPPAAVRLISVAAVIRHVSASEWEDGMAQGGAAPQLLPDLSNADFTGICTDVAGGVTPDGIPTIKLKFHDYTGLLTSKKIPPGAVLDRELPITESIAKFLRGTPGEGLCVKWLGPGKEPTVAEHLPPTQKKKKGKKSTAPLKSTQNYLDAIVEECTRLGCVPRVSATRLEISEAGPLYQGKVSSAKTSIVVVQSIESVSWTHQLIGVKTQPVQLVGYNPATGESLTARWPPDPKGMQPVVVKAGQPPRLPPVFANIGIPGFEQLDESMAFIPVGPIGSQDRLLKMAEAYFLERTRQGVKTELRTHCPWSDPTDPDKNGGDILRLRAGDTVSFAYLPPGATEDDVLLDPAVLATSGELGAAGLADVLERAGVAPKVASEISQLLTAVPRFSQFRVDELHVSGSDKSDPEITIKLVNFLELESDAQTEANGDPAQVLAEAKGKFDDLVASSEEDTDAYFAKKYAELTGTDEEVAAAQDALDELQFQIFESR
jgi:hypothetical protein